MTLSEFKAWFEGFTEDMDGAPNEKQWKRIKARVKDITGVQITERVFLDRYWPRYPSPHISYSASSCATPGGGTGGGPAQWMANGDMSRVKPEFDSHTAMLALGKADYAEMV